jgi:acetyl esterase
MRQYAPFLAISVGAALIAFAVTGAPASRPLDPEIQKFVDALAKKGGPPLSKLAPEDARKVLVDVQSVAVDKLPARIEEKDLPVGPTSSVKVFIIRPETARGLLPVIVYIHGGGWVMGDEGTHDRLIRELAVGTGAALIFVEYGRSPEVKFPVPVEQAYAVTKYVAEHGELLGVDSSRLAVVGDSVGGNMTAAVTLLAKERGGPRIAFQALFYPVTDASFDTASYKEFAEGPWLTKSSMQWFWNAYCPDVALRKQAIATPLSATTEQLKGLPPALLLVDENDVLRDEGEAYGRKLAEAGVRVTSVRYNGAIHDFMMLNPIATTAPVRGAVAQAIAVLRENLDAMPAKRRTTMGKLSGKVALVTGASKGIGAAIAKSLAAAGASVVVNYASSRSGADQVVKAIEAAGGTAVAAGGDVSRETDVKAIVDAAVTRFGRLDIVVNNAGVYEFAPIAAMTVESFRRHFDVNVLGPLLVTRAALKHLGEGSCIINIGSLASRITPPDSAIYSGTKGALDAITGALARELGPRKIRVNSINPGVVETEGTHRVGVIGSDFEKNAVGQTPLGRIGQPEDVAKVAVFLASEDAGWMTGERILAAGGMR